MRFRHAEGVYQSIPGAMGQQEGPCWHKAGPYVREGFAFAHRRKDVPMQGTQDIGHSFQPHGLRSLPGKPFHDCLAETILIRRIFLG